MPCGYTRLFAQAAATGALAREDTDDVILKLLRKARKGTRVIFIPGNHDEFARKYLGNSFGG